MVRNKIKMFAKTKVSLPPGRHKIVILDEADSMTTAAQQAMRRTMELYSSTTRFALACNASSKIIEPIQSLSARIRAANDCRDAALTTAKYAATLERAAGLDANQWLSLLTGIDALRRPERIDVLLGVLGAYSPPRANGDDDRDFEMLAGRVRAAAAALASIDYSRVSRDPSNVAEQVRAMRIEALQAWLGNGRR